MNEILNEQNSIKQIERLAAQRELYSSAKRFQGVQIFGTVAIPATAAIVTALMPGLSYYASIYGITFFVVDSVLIDPAIKTRRTKAASIQELFDCDLLGIVPSELKTATDITVEEVLKNYDFHARKASNIERLKNWYPVAVGDLPKEVAALVCQRLNYCWDSGLRRAYVTAIVSLSVLMACLAFGGFAIGRTEWTDLLLTLTAFLPYLRVATKQYRDQSEAAERLSKLNAYFGRIWQRILDRTLTAEELRIVTRGIQDEIYDSRKRSPLVPDFFFWFYRNTDESLTERTAAQLRDGFLFVERIG